MGDLEMSFKLEIVHFLLFRTGQREAWAGDERVANRFEVAADMLWVALAGECRDAFVGWKRLVMSTERAQSWYQIASHLYSTVSVHHDHGLHRV